jgi:hypothetical protein
VIEFCVAQLRYACGAFELDEERGELSRDGRRVDWIDQLVARPRAEMKGGQQLIAGSIHLQR